MKNNYWKSITGWFDFPEFYEMIFNRFEQGTFVEVGTWQGKSLMFMAEMISESNKNISLTGIDTFGGTGQHMLAEAGMKDNEQLYQKYLSNIAPLQHIIKTIRGNSHIVYEMFDDNSIDFLFIDGDHSYEAVKKDLESWYPKVKEGGIISGHDYTNDMPYGVIQAVDEFFKNLGDKTIKRCGYCVWYYEKLKEENT